MRKSLILFVLVFVYIWGCTSSEDKYGLISNDDRKAVQTICKCMEPLTIYKDKMQNAPDTTTKRMYKDSFEVKVVELFPCIENFEKLEVKFTGNEGYLNQFTEYVKEKHPKCAPLMLGVSADDTTKIKK